MAFDVSRILQDAAPTPKDMTLPETGPRTAKTIGSEIRYLSHQAKCMTVWFGVEIGKRLAEAKAMVGHGGWLDFLKNETEFSKSSAARFMQIAKKYGNNSNFPTLGNLSVSNALQLLAVPAEEREEFAEAVDAENLSARELEQAIRERTDAQAAKITELENRPVEVAVQAADPAEIEKAVADALAEAEKKHKADVAALEKRRKEAEKKQAELQAEAAKAMADLKNSTGRADDLTRRVETLQAELAAAKANAEKLQKAGAIQSDADIAVFQSFFQAVQENFNRACGLMQKVKTRDAEKAAKLARFSRDALAKMSALVEKEA